MNSLKSKTPSHKDSIKLLAFINSYTSGDSGGDSVFVEIYKRLSKYNLSVVTSKLGIEYCKKNGVKANYICTTNEKKFANIILTYSKRIFIGIIKGISLSNLSVIISSSDFLTDVAPSYFTKLRNPKALWIQHIFHLTPKSRRIPYYAQKLSFIFIKHKTDVIIVDSMKLKNELQKK